MTNDATAPNNTCQAPVVEPSNGIITRLAELPPGSQIDAEALARILGKCKMSVHRAVRRGELPAPFKFGGKNVWLVQVIQEHLEKRQRAALMAAMRRAEKNSRNST